jgi:hypothetical protein
MNRIAVGRHIAMAGVLVTLVLANGPIYALQRWPMVQEMHRTYSFSDVDKAGFDLELKGLDNEHKPLYMLKCHTGLYEADNDFDYSGLMDCRLVSLYSKETVSSLLTETSKQIADWSDRGRFLSAHLRKGCAAYPDWGRRRSFRLRGMDITIALSSVTFQKSPPESEKIQSYSVDVTVANDATAGSPIAQKPSKPEPPWFFHPAQKCTYMR